MLEKLKTLYSTLVASLVILPVGIAMAAPDVIIALPEFSGSYGENFELSGDAKIEEGALRLTPAVNWKSGGAFFNGDVQLGSERSFSAYFTMRMKKPGMADGIAFVLQPKSKSLKTEGRGLGYEGLAGSLVVEFDTFHNGENGEKDNNHIGISLDGSPHSVITEKVQFPLNDGGVKHAWVDYNGAAKILEVRVAESSERPKDPTLSYPVELAPLLAESIFVGFTAATGLYNQQHDVMSFYFNDAYIAQGITP